MNFETRIKKLSDRYLANVRAPDIAGFVDQFFVVAGETGTVGCVVSESKSLQFSVTEAQVRVMGLAHASSQALPTCLVEHEAAQRVLRMICARLGAICKERTASDISPYGDKAELDYEIQDHNHWIISFTNTPDRQEFLIEAA